MLDIYKMPLVFNVYKPCGAPSLNSVYRFKKYLNYDYGKIGHFGTLDPFAEGILLIGVQGAQKMNDYVHSHMPKTYIGTGVFGVKTKSGDLTTEMISNNHILEKFQQFSINELNELVKNEFHGEYWQRPHAYSATKHHGRRLYHLAQEGLIIEKEKVKRDVLSFRIKEFNYPKIVFEICVSSGTYIRSFFEDVAAFLGGDGHLIKLIRSSIGHLKIENSILDSGWPIDGVQFDLKKHGIPIDQLFILNELHFESYSAFRYMWGQRAPIKKAKLIEKENSYLPDLFWAYSEDNLLGLAKIINDRVTPVFNLPVAVELYAKKE
jgi:tRNA pseudouridine55 synthase